jgi:pilus assembly protein CpaB
MTRPSVWALSAGLIFAAIAFYLLYQKASEIERRSTPVEILVAKRYLPAQTPLNPSMVEKKLVPEDYVSPSAITDLKQVEGLVALAPLSAGEQIQSNKFGRSGESLGGFLEPGSRAYTLPVEEAAGVGGLLNPGDRVDLLVKGAWGAREATAFLYQNLRVLAVGGRSSAGPRTPGEDSSGPESGAYSHVTLAVSPEQAEILFFLEGRSSLHLTLRAAGDDERIRLPPEDGSDLMRRLVGYSKDAEEAR